LIIYKATNKVNGKSYIGQTVKGLSDRIAAHIRDSKFLFGKVLRKYGIQSFEISVIDSAETKEALNEKEKYWIQFYDSKAPNGYNLTDGGEGNLGWNPSEEVRQKMSDAHTPERKQALSEKIMGDNNPMKDRKIARKVADKNLGRAHSDSTKQKMSAVRKGKPKTDEHAKRISDSLKGHTVSEETRQKLSKIAKGRKHSEERKRQIADWDRKENIITFPKKPNNVCPL